MKNITESSMTPIKEIIERFRSQGPRFRERVRRCFMNGKPCIFCNSLMSEKTEGFSKTLDIKENQDDTVTSKVQVEASVFVVMPFRPNLDTFYDWSLKNYLQKGLGVSDKQIRRADDFRNIGYIMCEKICRRIQEADLVVVDVSLDNPNVFYELGLSVGLNKPLLIICDREQYVKRTEAFWHSIGIGVRETANAERTVVRYPNVGFLNSEEFPIIDRVTRVVLEPLKPLMRIVPLLVPEKSPRCTGDDIDVGFEEALKAALGVAIYQMKTPDSTKTSVDLRGFPGVSDALNTLDEKVKELWTDDKNEPYVYKKDTKEPRSFAEIAPLVDSAFTCIIDLAGERQLSYFWLGYCHARGINVIPIYRPLESIDSVQTDTSKKLNVFVDFGHEDSEAFSAVNLPHGSIQPFVSGDNNYMHVLAFDLRALWYIDFRGKEVRHLASLLKGVLEELVTRDVPRRERNTFWERLTRESTVHIVTGAVHHEGLGREVVGDWDLRTVSELVRFLSSADESVIPELVRPMYAPETIRQKMGSKWDADKSLKAYIAHIKGQLEDRNCLLIASADVNPVTEVALGYAYNIPDPYLFSSKDEHRVEDRVVIALKGSVEHKNQEKNKVILNNDTLQVVDTINPFFSRVSSKLKRDYRGFLVGTNNVLQEKYYSQDEAAKHNAFFVLAHLVVMRNPFSKRVKDTIIVILNGVSGPGTYGLAEVLTGGTTERKSSDAERLLKEINDKWTESDKRGFRGVEVIIKVRIEPEHNDPKQFVSDVRGITSWDKWSQKEDESPLTNGNPRAILTV